MPKLSPPAPENATTGTGIVDRLQAGAAKLVRIERTDAVGNDRGAVIARVMAAALRDDYSGARRELNTLPPGDRAPAQAWLDKANRATRRFPHRVISRPRPWRHSPNLRNRISMYRIILFLGLIALAAAGAAWVADQGGDVVLSWDGWRVQTTLPVFALALAAAIVAAMLAWSMLRGLWRLPERIRRGRRQRRHARGRHAVTQGLLAIGHGDPAAGRMHADVARRHAADDPLTLLLHAQSAQLEGDHGAARAAFHAMAEREDTRLLGLRGLFIEARRADDPVAAVGIAEQALKLSPASTWASHAVLGFRCAKGDGALERRAWISSTTI